MFTIEYVKNLRWANAEHTLFDCIVKYEEFDEELPTSANAIDPYEHIKTLWDNGLKGIYGTITEFTPYVPTKESNKKTAIDLLNATDWSATTTIIDQNVSNPYLLNQSDFLTYRSAIRDIALNATDGFINFPIMPKATWSK